MESLRYKRVLGINLMDLQQSKVWDSLLSCKNELEIGSRNTIKTWCKLDKLYNFNLKFYLNNLE